MKHHDYFELVIINTNDSSNNIIEPYQMVLIKQKVHHLEFARVWWSMIYVFKAKDRVLMFML